MSQSPVPQALVQNDKALARVSLSCNAGKVNAGQLRFHLFINAHAVMRCESVLERIAPLVGFDARV
jgi:hypothetical protein